MIQRLPETPQQEADRLLREYQARRARRHSCIYDVNKLWNLTMKRERDVLDDLDVLQIELAAITACTNRSDFDPLRPSGEQMTDNDYRAGIRETFADHPEWEGWMVEPLLLEVNRRVRERMAIEGFADMLVGAIMGRVMR